MNFDGYIGQDRIKREISLYGNAILKGRNLNLLIAGKSGYGKTTLVNIFLNQLDPHLTNTWRYIPDDDGDIEFDEDRRFHFVDEAHLLKNPERFYALMDAGQHTFIFATNEYDRIKEPVTNRCLRLTIGEYSLKDLAHISYNTFVDEGVEADKLLCETVARYSRNNPRVAKEGLSRKIAMAIKQYGYPSDLKSFIETNFAVYDGGFTQTDREYITALKMLGGRAGLDTLQTVLHLPRKVIIHEVEPFLISKGYLHITAKGRKLTDPNTNFRS